MTRPDPGSLWFAIGVAGAMALGVVLIPFRSLTSASNLAFPFLVLTMVIAELGGRGPGLMTAVVSTLSLNFFLTEPYLTLAIDKPDDVIAFVALAISGLVAAAFGRRRARSSELVTRARHDLDALDRIATALTAGAPPAAVLEGMRDAFRLGGLALRHADGRVAGAAPDEYARRPAPDAVLDPRTLVASGQREHRMGHRGFRLPEGGGRLHLGGDPEAGWLDLWEGDPEGLSLDERRALAVAGAMLALAIRPGSSAPPR
jgi:two-component system sensor histidine kinase KdpD